jgi:hypothetical protein
MFDSNLFQNVFFYQTEGSIDYNAHEIPIAAQSRQGHTSVSLNTIMHAVRIRLLTRQIHNARILPTAAAPRLRRSLPATALFFSSPTTPCVMTVMRMLLLSCGRTSSRPT